MFPKDHFLLGLIFSISLFFIFPKINLVAASIVFLSTLLIDVDHYLYFIFSRDNLSLKKAYRWFKERHFKVKTGEISILIFHGLEFLILLAILSFLNKIFLWVLIGSLFHLLLDFLEATYHKKPFNAKISQIYNLFNKKD